MDFRTAVHPLAGLQGLVSHESPLLLVGSCFSDNIGAELAADLFDVSVNPFGPLYNPLSILSGLRRLASGMPVDEAELFCHEGRWHHWDFHSRYSARVPAEAAARMNASIADGHAALIGAGAIFITLGTTLCYPLADGGRVVANCHKQPSTLFAPRSLTLSETAAALREMLGCIRGANPRCRVILTVSPLRYLGDGFHSNTLIKSTLHLAIAEVMASDPDIIYFPAYEIMNDDLRDYRFYADDMKHPSARAVRYIYDIFGESFFDPATAATARAGRRISTRLAHRGESPTEIKELALLDQYPALMRGYQRYLTTQR